MTINSKKETAMIQSGLFWQHPKGRQLVGRWVAVFVSPAGSRVHYHDIDTTVLHEEREKAQQLATEYGRDLTWEQVRGSK